MDDSEQIKRYADQELLMQALLKFLTTQINRSEAITFGLMKQCLSEWAAGSKMSIKKIKHQNEENRMRIIIEIIDLFTEKIKHLIESRTQREKLKNNILSIYAQWKKIHRKEGSEDVIAEVEDIISQ
jgi:hypothetical protein